MSTDYILVLFFIFILDTHWFAFAEKKKLLNVLTYNLYYKLISRGSDIVKIIYYDMK